MSVTVSHLTRLYGEQKAVDDVSFSIGKGEIVGFLGPNGAGKSTTMKILTGYLPPTSGKAVVCGRDITDDPLEVQRRTGYLPETNPLYPDMYVKEYLDFIAGLHHLPHAQRKARIAEMIRLTGLGPEQRKKIGALSKGYRQRVGLAQALLHDPEVLILDEPTSGLDPNQLAEIRQLIKTLGHDKTVILSTHIMQEVQAVCDRAIIIHQGRIVADDTLENLQSGVSGAVVASFAEEVDAALLEGIPEVTGVERLDPNRWRLSGPRPDAIRKNLLRFTLQNNLNIVSLQSNTVSLEEVFRELTGHIPA